MSISLNSIKSGTSILVEGEIVFSHVASQVKDLNAYNAKFNSRFPKTKPFSYIAIKDAKVLSAAPGEAPYEYIEEKLYNSKKHPDQKRNYRAENKGKYLPRIYITNADGTITEIENTDELAGGQKVKLMMRVFGSAGMNNGISLDAVIIESDTPVYYNAGAGGVLGALKNLGLIVTGDVLPAVDASEVDEIVVEEHAEADDALPFGNPTQESAIGMAQENTPLDLSGLSAEEMAALKAILGK